MNRTLSILLAATVALMAGCASLPPPQDRTASAAMIDTADTRLGRAVVPYDAHNPGRSGFHKFPEPHDAFVARVLLAGAAEKTLDAQYFIWNGDEVGYLLFEALWKAAERGVRVRLLLDDANTSGLDPTLAALDAHPRIEVRLYNPFRARGSRALGYMTDFARLNRRMHNKSFTADNQLSVVGGRNIANEYFGAGSEIGFADIDVLAAGPVVRDVEFRAAVASAPLMAELHDRKVAFEWTTAKVIYDDPTKTIDTTERTDVLLFPQLVKQMGRPDKSVDIVSPYFVPGDGGTKLLTDLAKRGVRVRVLTNSLAASDESIVHAGYTTRRLDLLRAGVALWELKPTAYNESLKAKGRFGAGKVAGLHAKTYAVDGTRIFVGSFNFDQRSARLNTEMGIVIDSTVLAEQLAELFATSVPELAYEVRLAPDDESLLWIERSAAGEETHYNTVPTRMHGSAFVSNSCRSCRSSGCSRRRRSAKPKELP